MTDAKSMSGGGAVTRARGKHAKITESERVARFAAKCGGGLTPAGLEWADEIELTALQMHRRRPVRGRRAAHRRGGEAA